MIDFFNGLSDRPYLEKTPEPTDPKLNVVHRSEEGIRMLYTTRNYERNPGRSRIEEVDDPMLCQKGAKRNCWNKDPHDPTLDARFEHRNVPIAPTPVAPLPDAKGRGPRAAIDDGIHLGTRRSIRNARRNHCTPGTPTTHCLRRCAGSCRRNCRTMLSPTRWCRPSRAASAGNRNSTRPCCTTGMYSSSATRRGIVPR